MNYGVLYFLKFFYKSSEWAILMIDDLWTLVDVQLVLPKNKAIFMYNVASFEGKHEPVFCTKNRIYHDMVSTVCAFVTENV